MFNTPSHHRVHHARNPKYLDKNYAGMFIIWDRMFGTFQPEEEQPVYGITKPLHSWNPLWANLHDWAELARDGLAGAALAGQSEDLVHAVGLDAAGRARGPAGPGSHADNASSNTIRSCRWG